MQSDVSRYAPGSEVFQHRPQLGGGTPSPHRSEQGNLRIEENNNLPAERPDLAGEITISSIIYATRWSIKICVSGLLKLTVLESFVM